MRRFKIWYNKFKVRWYIAYCILFKKYKHWVIFHVDRANLEKMLSDQNYDIGYGYHGLQKYTVHNIVRKVVASKDDIEYALDKAQFEANATDYKRGKK